MIINVEALELEQLEEQLSRKTAEFEKAFEEGTPTEGLNRIYKELKSLQIELNLRKIAVDQM
jgi:hypothetical protein